MTAADQHPLDELLAGYVLGDLDETELQQLRAALAEDPSLQTQLDELRVTLSLLPLAIPAGETPPPRLRHAVLKQEHGPLGYPPKRQWTWRLGGTQIGMAAMACAVLVMGLQVVQLRSEVARQRSNGPTLPDLNADVRVSRTVQLRGQQGQSTISGQMVVNAASGYNFLLIRGLPPAPPNHVYRLWAEVDGKSVGCVRFVPNADGIVSMPIPSEPSSHAKALSINLEPLRPDDSKPNGPQVLTSV